jgi:hypothetical protein
MDPDHASRIAASSASNLKLGCIEEALVNRRGFGGDFGLHQRPGQFSECSANSAVRLCSQPEISLIDVMGKHTKII